MDLFEYARELNKDKESPLAGRMRPATLDEVVGQEHIIGKDKLLYPLTHLLRIFSEHILGNAIFEHSVVQLL